MVEIPVRHKPKSLLPFWLLPVALVGVLGAGIGLSRAHTNRESPATVAERSGEAMAAAPACRSDQDCSSGQLCRDGSCAAGAGAPGQCSETKVSFATDSATIDPTFSPSLDRMASCLQAHQSLKLVIEGNTDQRGTQEHNADLAEQRARAVSHELQARGISPEQLRVVSYGESNPLCGESDADCWAHNRRAAVHTETR